MNNFVISYTHGKSLSVDLYRSLCVSVEKQKRERRGRQSRNVVQNVNISSMRRYYILVHYFLLFGK